MQAITKAILKQFKAAHWKSREEIEQFALEGQALKQPDMLKLIGYLDSGSSDLQHRSRIVAFQALCRNIHDPSLFGPLLKVAKGGTQVIRQGLVPVLIQCSSIESNREICSLLKSSKQGVRKMAADILKVTGGDLVVKQLVESIGSSGWKSRLEAVEVVAHLGGQYSVHALARAMQQSNTAEQILALRCLREERILKMGGRAAVEAVRKLMFDKNAKVVLEAIMTYGHLTNEDDFFNVLGAVMEKAEPKLIFAAIQGLSAFDTPRTIREIDHIYHMGDVNMRSACFDVLEKIGNKTVLPVLASGLSDIHLPLRVKATEILVRLGRSKKVEMASLMIQLLQSKDKEVKHRALEILKHIDCDLEELWPRLLDLLRDEDWWVRERVADVLVKMSGLKLTRHVAAFLKDPMVHMRRCAVDILMRLKDPRSLGALVRTAQIDGDWWVRERAIDCLGEIGDDSVVRHIIGIVKNNPALYYSATVALGKLKHVDALGFLCSMLRSEDVDIRLEAIRALESIGDRGVMAQLQPLLSDRDPQIRKQVQDTLYTWNMKKVDTSVLGQSVTDRLNGLDWLLYQMTVKGGDDLHLASGRRPFMKRMNEMVPLADRELKHLETMLRSILSPQQIEAMERIEDVDFSYEIKSESLRFRVNIFRQLTGWSAVFRKINDNIMSFDELKLPPLIKKLCVLQNGLVLVGGPTGSGKTTTLAAMIDYINRGVGKHIVTIEDPIEVQHRHHRGLIHQREVGSHTRAFSTALRSTLRQDPDVILVGEMRDLETIDFAIAAAETGHLVFGTVHTTSAETTVDRLINAFPPTQQPQIRSMLSESIRAVICQQLMRKKDGTGRIPAIEILLNNEAVRHLIRKGNCYQLTSVILTNHAAGMQSMDQELMRLYQADLVEPEEVYVKANNKKEFAGLIDIDETHDTMSSHMREHLNG